MVPGAPPAGVVRLHAATALLGAALVFLVQPVVARMLLPRLGGAASVWTTCLVFFQCALLAGYAWAHGAPAVVGLRRHAALHVALLVAALASLPVALRDPAPPRAGDPTAWMLGVLSLSVGVPFVLASASAPLLQRWLAARGAASPWSLYAASNVGSLVALLGYPTLVEPTLGLRAQGIAWSVGFALLAVLTAACARGLRHVRVPAPALEGQVYGRAPDARDRLRWAALAFVPSSLLLGATAYITTDLAAVPLLWAIPLTLYLVSFIVVFSREPTRPDPRTVASLAGLAVLLFVFTLPRLTPGYVLGALHLALLFLCALVFHGELARRRPVPEHLTAFYLSVAAGGALAGVLCALVAPRVFRGVTEYPLAIALAVVLLPRPEGARAPRPDTWRDVAIPVGVGLVAQGLFEAGLQGAAGRFTTYGLPVALCAVLSGSSRLRVGLSLFAIVVASRADPTALYQTRTFYGVLRVEHSDGYATLFHGTTIHGREFLDPALRGTPSTYYARGGPVGDVFAARAVALEGADVAVVGLGVGTLAAYARAGQRWTFFELDPAVVDVARRYFSFLARSSAASSVVLGDGRLGIAGAPPGRYGLIALDAFSSDAVPVHLLTREAFALDAARLRPGGVLLVNLTNRYVRLDGVLAAAARDLGLLAWVRRDRAGGRVPSTWALLARSPADVGTLAADPRWQVLAPAPGDRAWTDDRAGLLGVLRRPWP